MMKVGRTVDSMPASHEFPEGIDPGNIPWSSQPLHPYHAAGIAPFIRGPMHQCIKSVLDHPPVCRIFNR
ncbi:MAG: hypothetical protein IPN29_06060 [Saprospiraceae bacterium]|nr:hypothetical protein [Saprospiraceae bacterium]